MGVPPVSLVSIHPMINRMKNRKQKRCHTGDFLITSKSTSTNECDVAHEWYIHTYIQYQLHIYFLALNFLHIHNRYLQSFWYRHLLKNVHMHLSLQVFCSCNKIRKNGYGEVAVHL